MSGLRLGSKYRRDTRKASKGKKTSALDDPKVLLLELGVSLSIDCILSALLAVTSSLVVAVETLEKLRVYTATFTSGESKGVSLVIGSTVLLLRFSRSLLPVQLERLLSSTLLSTVLV